MPCLNIFRAADDLQALLTDINLADIEMIRILVTTLAFYESYYDAFRKRNFIVSVNLQTDGI